jgi:hypothetical protein
MCSTQVFADKRLRESSLLARRLILEWRGWYGWFSVHDHVKDKLMNDFKLISADGHINEPPAAWERVQHEYGEKAPRVVKDPEGFKGIWVITEGLPPSPCSNYSIGHVVSKPAGLGSVDLEKHYERLHFHENFTYENFPASWEPAARIKDQDADGVAGEVLFASVGRFFLRARRWHVFSARFFALIMLGSMIFVATIANVLSA